MVLWLMSWVLGPQRVVWVGKVMRLDPPPEEAGHWERFLSGCLDSGPLPDSLFLCSLSATKLRNTCMLQATGIAHRVNQPCPTATDAMISWAKWISALLGCDICHRGAGSNSYRWVELSSAVCQTLGFKCSCSELKWTTSIKYMPVCFEDLLEKKKRTRI